MIFKVKTYIYPIDFWIILDESDEMITKRFGEKAKKLLNLSPYSSGRTEAMGLDIGIRIVSYPNKYDMLELIHHEINHGLFFMMNRLGVTYDKEVSSGANEAFTYAGAYLFRNICEKLKI